MAHATTDALTDRLAHLRQAPTTEGRLVMVVRRPDTDERQILAEGSLDPEAGLIGDNWLSRATSHAIAEGRHLAAQLNVMSARMVALLADSPERQALAGDQLFVDLDISHDNLPTGTQLAIGDSAIIEVTDKPHNGCAKFRARFGDDALAFVNSDVGKQLRLRGFNARVVSGGVVRPGDRIVVLAPPR